MTTNNQKLLIALNKHSYITATKSKILDPTFSSTSELTITDLKTKKNTTLKCASKFDHLHSVENTTLGILENSTAEIYTDKLIMTHEISAPYAFAYNTHKKMLAICNPLMLINMVDYKIYNPGEFKHNFKCLSWNNKVHHILATITENRIVILDLKNKKEVVNVPLENYKISDVNNLMWHWSELTSLILACKDGTYKINLSDNTTVKISNCGEKVLYNEYLVCTDYRTVEFYDKDLKLLIKKDMNICDIDVDEENIAISYMDKKPEIIKKSRFIERYAGNKQINFIYFNNKIVHGLNGSYKIKNDHYERNAVHEDLALITNTVEGKDVDIKKYFINEDDKQQTITIATIKKILNKEIFTDDEYKNMNDALVLLLSQDRNEFDFISKNIDIKKWANLVNAINKSNSAHKKRFYDILRDRLENENMKNEAMIVCVFSQDFEKLLKMQIDLLEPPKSIDEVNSFFEKYGFIVDSFKAINVKPDGDFYEQYLSWVDYNKENDNKEINAQFKNLLNDQSKNNNNSVKQNVYNNANYSAMGEQKVFVPQRRGMPTEPMKQATPMFNKPKIGVNSAFLPPKQNVVQQNQPTSTFIPSASPIPHENAPAAKPKMTYGQINQQQVKNVMGHPNMQRPGINLQPNVINQRPASGVVPPINTLRAPNLSSPVINQRPVQVQKPPIFSPSNAKTVAPPRQQPIYNQNQMPSPQLNTNTNQQPDTNTNLLSVSQKNEYMNAIQKKINHLITESSKKNGFFHKNKITSSMKRLQFYEINKDAFTDELIINLHSLLEMVDEKGNQNRLEAFKAKLNDMNGIIGNACGFDVFGLGLLGLYQVVVSEK